MTLKLVSKQIPSDQNVSQTLIEYWRLASDRVTVDKIAKQAVTASAGFVNHREALGALNGLLQIFAFHVSKVSKKDGPDETPTILFESLIDRMFQFLVRESLPYQQLCKHLGFQVVRIPIGCTETSRLIFDLGGVAYQERELSLVFGKELDHGLHEWNSRHNKSIAISSFALPMSIDYDDSFDIDLLDLNLYSTLWSK